MTKRKVPALELEQDPAFQRANWRAERIGWAVMAAVLLAGLGGALGHGPLGDARAGEPGGPLRVAYQRLVHHRTPEAIVCHVAPAAAAGRPVRLWFSQAFLRDHRFDPIIPAPEREVADADRVTYVFAAPPAGAGLVVRFTTHSDGYGLKTADMGLADGPAFALGMFVFP